MPPNRVKIRTDREHDLTAWKSMGPWVQNRLLLMDLGYHSSWLFHRIDAHGGFFLSRLKTNSALVITKDLRTGVVGKRGSFEWVRHEARGRQKAA